MMCPVTSGGGARKAGASITIRMDRHGCALALLGCGGRTVPSSTATMWLQRKGGPPMAEINVDQLGPVDYLVVRFPEGKARFTGEMADELKQLIESGTIRVLDLVILAKSAEGSIDATELRDVDDSDIGEFRGLERDLAVLLAQEDVERIGEMLEPASAAAILVWENSWAAPFGSAVRRSGGELVTSGRIPTQALIAAVEAERAATPKGA